VEALTLGSVLFLVGAGFLASFVDSVVGGGGLISLPSLLFVGLPPALALGTNKLAGVICSFTSSMSFLRSGKVDRKLVRVLFPVSFAGSVLGVLTVRHLPPDFLRPLVVVLLAVVAAYTFFRKDWGGRGTYAGTTPRVWTLGILFALALGYYDGFFGPGAGSFLLFAFLTLGFDFVLAAGNARVLNFASNIAAILTFALLGTVNWAYGLVMGVGMVAGALLGSRVALTRGAAFVRPLFLIVTALLIGKQLWSLLS
jgi:uncharacterized membrane protein YfcA